jgi:hypothetical protein
MRHQVGAFMAAVDQKRRSRFLACDGLALKLAASSGADHVEGMRKFGLLLSVVLVTGLSACAETAGPDYAYAPPAPGYAYAPGYGYGGWPYGYGVWPEGYYCCGPGLVEFGRFHNFSHFHHDHFGQGHFGHGHFGGGGHHR